MKVLAFGASTSRASINKALASYAVTLLDGVESEVIDLNDYEMPLYSTDLETEKGIPEEARAFYQKITEADALVISYAEHNGYYPAAYKNIFDWASRINKKFYQNKPAVLLATSPGGAGAASVLKAAKESAPFFGMEVKASLSVPQFHENFDVKKGEISNQEIKQELQTALNKLKTN